jgi:hypothetical protein
MNWAALYSNIIHVFDTNNSINKLIKFVEFVDIGCGYGGLLGKLFFDYN